MNAITRAGSVTAGALVLSTFAVPAANAASEYASATGIRVCVSGLRGGDADVSVAGRYVNLNSGECAIFGGLTPGRTYRVTADGPCDVDGTRYVRASGGSTRSVSFYGDCGSREYRSYGYGYDNDRSYGRGYRRGGHKGGHRPGNGHYNGGGNNGGGYNGGGKDRSGWDNGSVGGGGKDRSGWDNGSVGGGGKDRSGWDNGAPPRSHEG